MSVMLARRLISRRLLVLLSLLVTLLLFSRHKTAINIHQCITSSPPDVSQQYKHRQLVQLQYQDQLASLDSSQRAGLSAFYHRNVTLQWGGAHGLLPPSKPLAHRDCLRVLDRAYDTPVSVVICYKNELLTLLLRCLTTIAQRTPAHLLAEIVVIDDGSESNFLPEIMDYSAKQSIPVRLLRNEVSMGIANARHHGISTARSDVVVLLDSHMEVSDTWLEPLLAVLEEKPLSAAVPLVQLIQEKEYSALRMQIVQPYGVEMTSGFDMLRFYYAGPPAANLTQPYATSSFGGGAVAAYRSTFLKFYPRGLYNTGWGVENNRFALRLWMCGEGMWVPRCSQILHTNGNDVMLTRYSANVPNMFGKLRNENLAEILNFMRERKERERMLDSILLDSNDVAQVIEGMTRIAQDFDHAKLCLHDYSWYLAHIHKSRNYTYFDTPDFLHVGEVQSAHDPRYCIASVSGRVRVESGCRRDKVLFYDTHMVGFSANHAVHVHTGCWDAMSSEDGAELITYGCHTPSLRQDNPGTTQQFVYDAASRQIRHVPSGRCAEVEVARETVILMPCREERPEQLWIIHKPRWRNAGQETHFKI